MGSHANRLSTVKHAIKLLQNEKFSRQQEKVVLRQKELSIFQFQHGFSENSAQLHLVNLLLFFLFLLPDPKNTFGNPTESRMDNQTFKNPISISPSARYSHCQYVFVRCWILKKNQTPSTKISNSKKRRFFWSHHETYKKKSVNIEMLSFSYLSRLSCCMKFCKYNFSPSLFSDSKIVLKRTFSTLSSRILLNKHS